MDPTDPVGVVMAVAKPLFLCMPLECPEPGAGGYEEMGMCNLIINIGLGSIAPMLPILDFMAGLMEIPPIPPFVPPPELPALPFIGLTIPPLPFPDPIGMQGSLDIPGFSLTPPLLDLLLGVLTIPLDMCIGIIKLEIPDLSLDGMMGLLIPALMLPGIEAPMLPTLGLLDLAICIIILILLPFLILALLLQSLGVPAAALAPLPPLEAIAALDVDEMMEEFSDKEKVRASAEKVLAGIVKEEQKKAAKRKAAQKDVVIEEDAETEWKPSIKDYYYG